MFVWVRGGNIEQALSVLRRKMVKDGVLTEVRSRRSAMSKGEKRKQKDKNAVLRKARKARKRRKALR